MVNGTDNPVGADDPVRPCLLSIMKKATIVANGCRIPRRGRRLPQGHLFRQPLVPRGPSLAPGGPRPRPQAYRRPQANIAREAHIANPRSGLISLKKALAEASAFFMAMGYEKDGFAVLVNGCKLLKFQVRLPPLAAVILSLRDSYIVPSG